jgi:hypothetical protein
VYFFPRQLNNFFPIPNNGRKCLTDITTSYKVNSIFNKNLA